MTLKDSGDRRKFETGAQRDVGGKGRCDLLPVRALLELSKLYEEGAKKYDDRNWEKGIPLSSFLDSGIRHALKYLAGYRDEPHDVQAAWNLLCLIDTKIRIDEGLLPKTLDDLPELNLLGEPTPKTQELDPTRGYFIVVMGDIGLCVPTTTGYSVTWASMVDITFDLQSEYNEIYGAIVVKNKQTGHNHTANWSKYTLLVQGIVYSTVEFHEAFKLAENNETS